MKKLIKGKDKKSKYASYFTPDPEISSRVKGYCEAEYPIDLETVRYDEYSEPMEEIGFCEQSGGPVDLELYRKLGCWNCFKFNADDNFPYMLMSEAAVKLGVSRATVMGLVMRGILKGHYLEQETAPPRWHIEKESVDDLLRRRSKG